jgi:chromate reductase
MPQSHPMSNATPILIFAGSSRRDSLNRKLAEATAALARDAGAEVTVADLTEFELPIYHGDLEAEGLPAGVLPLKRLLHAHPAWIISTPEYNGSYPALLKNAIDWTSRPVAGDAEWANGLKPFAGKVVGLLAASPGPLGGTRSLSHLAPLLRQLQCWVAPRQYALAKAGEAFDAEGKLVDTATRTGVRDVVEQVLWAAQRLQG